MISITLGGRVLQPSVSFKFSKPSRLRSGYRGPRAGSREAGSVSFELFFLNGYQTGDLWFSEGAQVLVAQNGVTRFRGLVTGIEIPKRRGYTVPIEAIEDMGKLADLDTGMLSFGNLENTSLFCWKIDGQPITVGHDDHDDPITARGSIFRAGDFFSDEFQAARRGYQQQKLFDTYGYRQSASPANQFVRRTLLMYEQPLLQVVRRLVNVNGAAGGPQIDRTDVDLTNTRKAPQMFQPIRDENGITILPAYEEQINAYKMYGLFERNLAPQGERGANLATLYWREIYENDAKQIELYQILNHSVARKLGQFAMHNPHWTAGEILLDSQPVHSFEEIPREGPFAVHDSGGNLIGSSKLAWFFMWGYSYYDATIDKTYFVRRATVYEVDLLQVLDDNGQALGHTRHEIEASSLLATATPDWVHVENGVYSLINNPQPLVQWQVARTGGKYEISRETGALGPVFWIGDLYLSDIACEFEGTTLADALHNLGLATGTEWWVDGQGVLKFRKIETPAGTSTLRAQKVFEDYVSRRPADKSEGEEVSGIPLSDLHQIAIRQANFTTRAATQERRITRIWPDHNNFELGQEIILDQESLGKLVAFEVDDPVVQLECEP